MTDRTPTQPTQPTQQGGLLTPAEVAAMFRVNPKTVTRWAKAGKLASARTLGGHRRYYEAEVRAWLAGNPPTPCAGWCDTHIVNGRCYRFAGLGDGRAVAVERDGDEVTVVAVYDMAEVHRSPGAAARWPVTEAADRAAIARTGGRDDLARAIELAAQIAGGDR